MNKLLALWDSFRVKRWKATHEVAVIQNYQKKYVAIFRRKGGRWKQASSPLFSKREAQRIAENLPHIVSPYNL